MEIEQFLKQITETCKKHMDSNEWSKNDAMRYAYVTLGKQLSKSARFFYSMEGKYGQCGLSVEEMKNIHYANASYEVTCNVSANMLKTIFDELGIKSTILYSVDGVSYSVNGETLNVYHSYLLCEGNEGKKYFMSINSDLVNLKFNFKTDHFANDVPYVFNGVQTYQGENVNSSKLSQQEIFEIDSKIGYAFPITDKGKIKYIYANYDPSRDHEGKKRKPEEMYLMDNINSLDGYFISGLNKLFSSFVNPDGSEKTNFSELTNEEIRSVEWYVYSSSLNLIKKILHINLDDEIFSKEISDLFGEVPLDLEKIKLKTKELINNYNGSESDEKIAKRENPFVITSTALLLVRAIEDISNPQKTQTETERNKLFGFYQDQLKKVALLFVSSDELEQYTGDNHPSNTFLINKIKHYIEKDFECATSASCGYLPEFCTKLGLVEQSTFLKSYLKTILNLELSTETNFKERILFTTISELSNPDSCAFLIHVMSESGTKTEPLYSLIYDPKINQIQFQSFLSICSKYRIMSKSVLKHFFGDSLVEKDQLKKQIGEPRD